MSKITILIVEDEAGVRFGLREFLTSKGFETIEAESCAEAEKLSQSRTLDFAIIDYRLPDGNAIELMQRIRATNAGTSPPSRTLTTRLPPPRRC